nr:RHS repeat-associated core domain-containing protein [Salmonella enterica]
MGLAQLIRLPGQQYDEESGLYYNRHRYYEPGMGRYITQDPIGLAGGGGICINTPSIRCCGSTRWDYLKIFLHLPMHLEFSMN